MQQIERYGVIALVFLLVTIVAVSFWGDSKSPGFWSRLTGRGKKDASSAQTANLIPPATSTERAIDGSLPLSMPADAQYRGYASEPVQGGSWMVSEPTPTLVPSGAAGPASTASYAPYHPEPIASPQPETAASHAPVFSAPPPPTGPQYVVQKGDSLIRIAVKTLGNGSRWTEIQALNGGVDPRSLQVGMKLVLPASAKAQKSGVKAPEPSRRTSPASGRSGGSSGTYVVRSGDTLTSIAARHLGDGDRWREILAANPGLKPNRLLVGKSIRMPGGDASRGAAERTTELAAVAPRSAAMPPPSAAITRSPDRPRVR